jgi:hypothetical protein
MESGLLPRPLRDPELLRHIRALDAMHEQEGRAGSFVVEVHYDHEGKPRKAWVQARVEFALSKL